MPFDLSRIRLLPGPLYDEMQVNRRFLLAQDPDRLLHTFRLNAGLPSSAEPLGGWEAPVNELRGHYTGHYLSACALIRGRRGMRSSRRAATSWWRSWRECQQPNGYLSAFPEEFFDRLRADRPVWAPFYTYHKIMAGLLDMHTLRGQRPGARSGARAWRAGPAAGPSRSATTRWPGCSSASTAG